MTEEKCTVDGCNGEFGPGCMVTPQDPSGLYFKCIHNKRFLERIWDATKPEVKDDHEPEPSS